MSPIPPTRRHALAGLSASAVVLASLTPAGAQASPPEIFRQGVASGDPDATSIVLWTRVTASGPVEVEWELADDPAFTRPVQGGRVVAGPERDVTG